jgi:hypothetical protein
MKCGVVERSGHHSLNSCTPITPRPSLDHFPAELFPALDTKGARAWDNLSTARARMVLKRGYLFVIFVTFCANVPWCFRGLEQSNHLSQKIAKDAKANLGHRGPRLGQPLDRPSARMVLKEGISL